MRQAAPAASPEISHNLLGQRLGRKGRGTRERILAAAARVLADPRAAFSLSAVAREASLGMTTLYLYFGDLTALLIAVLEPVMASAEDLHVAHLRRRWSDATLDRESLGFITAFHDFWQRHARVLHLRNSLGTAADPRLTEYRNRSTMPLIRLLVLQMDGDPEDAAALTSGVATALLTGIERVATVTTDEGFARAVGGEPSPIAASMLRGQAHVLALAVRDARGRAAG